MLFDKWIGFWGPDHILNRDSTVYVLKHVVDISAMIASVLVTGRARCGQLSLCFQNDAQPDGGARPWLCTWMMFNETTGPSLDGDQGDKNTDFEVTHFALGGKKMLMVKEW